MSVPAEILQNILLEQQEHKNFSSKTPVIQIALTLLALLLNLPMTLKTATHLMHGSRDGTTLFNMNFLTKMTTGKSGYSYESWVHKKTKGSSILFYPNDLPIWLTLRRLLF